MEIYTLLKDLGLIATLGGGVVAFCVFIIKYVTALARGVQALLRTQLYEDYNKWQERGYAPIEARQNFENCYQRYHRLGKNGVMDDIHEKFLHLPTECSDKQSNTDNQKGE
jgi:hypothetical protein